MEFLNYDELDIEKLEPLEKLEVTAAGEGEEEASGCETGPRMFCTTGEHGQCLVIT